MDKFKVGDKVRIITDKYSYLFGEVGVVTYVCEYGGYMVGDSLGYSGDQHVGNSWAGKFNLFFREYDIEPLQDELLLNPDFSDDNVWTVKTFDVKRMYDDFIVSSLSGGGGTTLTFGGKRYRLTLTEVEEDIYTEEDAYYDGTYDQDE